MSDSQRNIKTNKMINLNNCSGHFVKKFSLKRQKHFFTKKPKEDQENPHFYGYTIQKYWIEIKLYIR